MGRSKSRSRSRGRGGQAPVAEAAKSGSSEQEIVSVAIRQLPGDIRERLEKLFEEGLLKEGDLDLRSITVFASLNEGLQARVMNHMENERIYVANARSKSGFLIATCDKAKTGCLDARGLGAIDPWRTALVAMATPKQKMIDMKPERDWLETHDEGKEIKINVSVGSCESELGMPSVTVELPLTETSAAIKAKLVAMGVKSIPANRMKFHTDPVGFLKDRHSFAFYNLEDGVTLTLSSRKRAGTKFRSDHTVMPKRPKTQPAPGEAPAQPLDALKNLTAGKLPGLPSLPKLPGMPGAGGTAPAGLPGLPGLPSLPGLPALGGGSTLPGLGGIRPGGLPGLAGLPGLPGLPGLTLPGMGGASTAPAGLPGLPKAGDPKAGGLLGGLLGGTAPGAGGLLAGLGGTSPGGGLDPKIAEMMANLAKAKAGGGLPGLPPPGADPKAAAMAAMLGGGGGSKAGGLPGLPGMTLPGGLSLPKMPGMPGLPGMTLPGGMTMPNLSAMLPKGGADGGVPSKGGGLPGMPNLAGLMPMGATPKGGAPP